MKRCHHLAVNYTKKTKKKKENKFLKKKKKKKNILIYQYFGILFLFQQTL